MAEVAVAAVAAITGLTGTAAAVATTAIATVAATSAVAILSTQADAPKSQGQLNNLELASNAPRRLQIGQRGNGGTLIDHYTYGDKNQFAELVIYLGEGPMGSITGVWSSGRKVYSGSIGHGARVQLTEFDSPDARVYVEYYDGRPGQVAPAGLTARLAAGGNDTWPSTNIAKGCAYAVVTCRWDPDTVPAIPSFFFELEGAKLYDRRKDGTAGGSGSHRLKDPSTWEVSSNPAVALDHYVLGRFLESGDASPVFGVGLDPSVVNYSRFAAMANLCDEAVAVEETQWYTTTQPRYEANGIIFANETYKDVILNLCRAMNARAADFGGEIGIIDNEAKAAVMDITDADVVARSVETYSPKKSRDDLIGGVRGTYQDPANNYNPVDYPEYTDASWATEDGEELEYDDFNLDFEIDPERAQRLAKLHGFRSRRQATLQGFYHMKTLALEDGDWFTRTTAKFPSGKAFEVVGSPVLDTATMTIKINAIEVDTSDSAWNAATDARPVIDPTPVASALPPQLGTSSVSLTAATETGDGGTEIPMVVIRNLSYSADDIYGLDIEISLNISVPPAANPSDAIRQFTMPAGQEYVNITDVQPSTNYVIRTRPRLGVRTGTWSDWEAITTSSNQTALEVVGQGYGATADKNEVANYIPIGKAPGLLPNSRFLGVDTEGGVGGIEPVEGTNSRAGAEQIDSIDGGLRITTTDQTVAYGFPAIPIDDKATYQVRIRHRSVDGSSASGLYLRFNERNSELDDGTSHVGPTGNRSSAKTSSVDVVSNGASPGSSFQEDVYTYTPTPGTRFASFSMYRWTGFTGDYEIEWVQLGFEGDYERGADPTEDNIAAGIDDQSELATSSITEAILASMQSAGRAANENPFFSDPTYGGSGVPPGWSSWQDGGSLTRGDYQGRSTIYGDAGPVATENLGLFQVVPLTSDVTYRHRLVVARTGGSTEGMGSHISFRDSSNATNGNRNLEGDTDKPTSHNSVTSFPDGITVYEEIFTPPSGTVNAYLYAMWGWNGYAVPSAGAGFQGHILECSITPVDETERRTSTQEDNADPTGDNIAAGFDDQGDQATANSGYGLLSARPASPPNGSWYGASDEGVLYYYAGGGWNAIANFSSSAAGMTYTITSEGFLLAEVSGSGAGSATTGTPGITISGATGTVSYLWQRLSGDEGISVSSSTIANPTFSGSVGAADPSSYLEAVWRCRIKDDNQTIFIDVQVKITNLF